MGTNNMLTGLNPSAGQNTSENKLVMAYKTNYIDSLFFSGKLRNYNSTKIFSS